MIETLNAQRRAAADAGQTKFYTGQPCKRGHLSPRYTKNGGCIECMRPMVKHPGSGMKWHQIAIALPNDVQIPVERAAELETLIRGWAAFKLREWGVIAPAAPAWSNIQPGTTEHNMDDDTYRVMGLNGWEPTTKETRAADRERIRKAAGLTNAG